MHLAQGQSELNATLRTVGMGNIQYAESLGVLGPELLAAHCHGILDEEVDLLGKYQVRVAHCPVTLLHGGCMVPPIWELEEKGAIVGLGTDSSATNNGQNPWEGMKMAIFMQRVRENAGRFLGTAEQALELATIKSARALGMDDQVGSLESGKKADIAMFHRDQLHLIPDAMLVSNLVYSGSNNMADTVLVGGRVLLRNGCSTVSDENEIVARVREAQKAMISEAGLEGEIGLTSSWPVITH
jgi:5-methylthioadenosine/S-adenosylhomocysteine deaminase